MYVATNIVEKNDKAQWVYLGYGIAFHEAGLWSIGNNFARNAIIIGVNNSSFGIRYLVLFGPKNMMLLMMKLDII